MAYAVKITPRAIRDLARLFDEIRAGHSNAALKWYRGLRTAILSLREQPDRCPLTAESNRLRNLLHGHKPYIYRVIYRVLEKQKEVNVLHIRHGPRKKFKPPR